MPNDTALLQRTNAAIRSYTKWRFRVKHSDTQDAVYVAVYTQLRDEDAYSYKNFLSLPEAAFAAFKLQFPHASFIDVPPHEQLINKAA